MTDTDRWLIWLGVPLLVLLVAWLQRKIDGWGKGRGVRKIGTVQAGSNHGRPFPEPSTEGGDVGSGETKGAAKGPGLRGWVGARPIAPRLRTWLLIALSCAAPSADAADSLTVGVLAASAADLTTTVWAFHTMPSARDGNPMIHGSGSAAAMKLGATAGVLLLDREFKRRGHRRASKVLRVAAVVAWGSAAAWNVRQIRRR